MTNAVPQIQLRPMEDTDIPRIAELITMFAAEPITAEDLTYRYQMAPQERIQQSMIALDEQGCLVGFSQITHNPWMASGKFWITVTVDRERHNQGIGSLLYTTALQFAESQGACQLGSEIREDQQETLRFAQQRGFTIERHAFESTLNLARFDETRFQGIVEQVEESGIGFFSLAEFGNTLESQQKLYELLLRVSVDLPGNNDEDIIPPFEQMQKLYLAKEFHADAQMIAVDGEDWIGFAYLTHNAESNSMYNAGTGVDRAYRGRHIALALKLLSIRCARHSGAAYLRTNNDSENGPMLAINRKLGYVSQPGRYMVRCELARAKKATSIGE